MQLGPHLECKQAVQNSAGGQQQTASDAAEHMSYHAICSLGRVRDLLVIHEGALLRSAVQDLTDRLAHVCECDGHLAADASVFLLRSHPALSNPAKLS